MFRHHPGQAAYLRMAAVFVTALAALACATITVIGHPRPAAVQQQAKTDAHGDPLPAGTALAWAPCVGGTAGI